MNTRREAFYYGAVTNAFDQAEAEQQQPDAGDDNEGFGGGHAGLSLPSTASPPPAKLCVCNQENISGRRYTTAFGRDQVSLR
jgi:hypothetical protein